ncbi:MAG: cell wall metabolism sensor histidine kinase WalK [Blautia sp.]|nr:cell wall metabolism sensor histidine kinase WalK [Blautia sp.]
MLKNVHLKKLQFLRSLRIYIFLIVFIVGLVSCNIMRYTILQNYEQRAVSLRISDVQAQLQVLANHLIVYRYLQDTSSEVIDAELNLLSNLYDGRVIIINNNLRVVKDTYGISENKIIISEEVIRCLKGDNTSNYDSENGYIEMTIPIMERFEADIIGMEIPENMPVESTIAKGVMLISVSTDNIAATMEILNRKALVLEFIVIMIIFAASVMASYLLVRPFERLTDALRQVKEGYTNDPVCVPDCLETENIGDAFNEVVNRMRVLDDSRQEFVSNVSHELKTPITSMKVLADSLRGQDDVPIELYREFMEDIATEIDREDKIINDLLALSKMDRAASDLNISQVDINALVEFILKRLRPIALKKDVELVYESIRPVTAEVDEVKITLVITNLVENAIKYNREHGWVKVTLDADHQFFTVEVADSGIGIPQESMEHIYERFYRVDKSHSREIEGSGLGLAITRSAILMHRGLIKAVSEEGEGTTFTVKIPLIHISIS